MSRTQTASFRPARWARATASASVSWSAWRVASPVSASVARSLRANVASPGLLDRRPGMQRDCLERPELGSGDGWLLVPAEDREEPEAAARPTRSELRPPTASARSPRLRRGSGTRARRHERLRRPGGPTAAPTVSRVDPDRRHERRRPSISTVIAAAATPGSDAAASAHRVKNLVEVERPAERLEDPRPQPLLADPLDRVRELLREAVEPIAHLLRGPA